MRFRRLGSNSWNGTSRPIAGKTKKPAKRASRSVGFAICSGWGHGRAARHGAPGFTASEDVSICSAGGRPQGRSRPATQIQAPNNRRRSTKANTSQVAYQTTGSAVARHLRRSHQIQCIGKLPTRVASASRGTESIRVATAGRKPAEDQKEPAALTATRRKRRNRSSTTTPCQRIAAMKIAAAGGSVGERG